MSGEKYFDQVAAEWDRLRASFFSEKVREKAFAVAGVEPGRIAADVGAGTGFITEGLVRKGVQVIAVEPSAGMLQQLRAKLDGRGEIDFRMGEVEALPIEDQTVDYVFANMVLHHVPSPPAAVKEMARILRPGGKLVVTDMDEHSFEFLRQEQHDLWLGFKRVDVRRWFEEAGLADVVVDCVGENCCAESTSGDEVASVSLFVASGVRTSSKR